MKNLNENHNLDDFECEIDDLAKFLKEDALNQQNLNLSFTRSNLWWNCCWICINSNRCNEIKIIEDKETKDKILSKLNISENSVIPAIKIGRFAIDKKYAHNGLGKHVFRNVLLSILDISENIVGLRFITVDAYASHSVSMLKNTNSNIWKKIKKKLIVWIGL